MRLLIVLLCWSMGAWGADHYVDCSAATDGAGTEGDPFNSLEALALSASDNVYLKAGVTCDSSQADTTAAMILIDAATVTVDTYGGDERATLAAETTIPYGIKILGVSGVTLNNVDITYPAWNAVRIANASGGTVDMTTTLNNVSGAYCGPGNDTDAGTGASAGGTVLWKGTCFIAGTESANNYAHYTIDYNNVDASYAARLGFDCRGKCTTTFDADSSAAYSGCYDSGAATVSGGHGFSSHPTSTRVTSGWTNVSGTIYKRNVISAFDVLQVAVNESVSPTQKAYGLGGTDGAPAWDATELHGEVQKVANGVAGCANAAGCIFVNLGADISAASVLIIRQPTSHTYVGSKSYETCDITGNEGHGFIADDYTNAYLSRVESFDNEGNGVNLLGSTDGSVKSSVIYNNGGKGIYGSGADSLEIENNSLGGNAAEQIDIAGRFKTGTVKNNAAQGGTYGIRFQHNALTLVTEATNAAYGASTDNCTGLTCTESDLLFVVANPTTAEGFRLQASSPARYAGTYLGPMQDYDNRRFKQTPSIGAWESASGDAATRTARGAP